ncbi:hypothetical protein SLS62_003588 [Diatrype stigma]|uniref:Lipoprotein n=1 Tax=Diatrype stigma TaxID=117547 RepID=A0AAN9YUE2_9PEZI
MKPLALLLAAGTALFSTGACLEKNPPRLAGKPTKMSPEEFPWTDPFASSEEQQFLPACSARRTFRASEFLLDDLALPPPRGLEPYSGVLKKALRDKPYPGGWDGVDPHGYDRSLVQMDYADVPVAVRDWIEKQQQREDDGNNGGGGSLFSVFERKGKGEKATEIAKPPENPRAVRGGEDDPADKDKVVLFAPGAIYRALPLWVAEGSDCADTLSDLSRYSSSPSDGAVVAWTTEHTKAKRSKGRDIDFTITAQVLKKAEEGEGKAKESPSESTKEEL